jgi:hypothetical protein
MAAALSQVFRVLNNQPTNSISRRMPMINEITNTLTNYLSARGQIAKKKILMNWYKRIPELTALTNKVARDVVYKWHFESLDPTKVNKNKIMRANRFAQEIELNTLFHTQMVDMLVTGEGFGWKGKLSDKQVKEVINKVLKKEIFLEKKEKKEILDSIMREAKNFDGFSSRNFNDEDILRPRKYRNVPSTTIEIVFNQFDVLHYNHIVGIQNPIKFKPEEIIRYTLMEVDGKINGFTAVEAVLVQLELLRQMWQNQLSLHKNGGHPDKLFILENVRTNTNDYKRIEEQLLKYKLVENKHGNMLFTGKVNVEDLNQLDNMQFKDLGLYITGLVAMQWGIPKSSIPYIVEGQAKTEDKGGDSERNYWRNIDFAQTRYAETMNTQLWIPHFGVKIVFDSPFPQDDVTRQTARNMLLNNVLLENQLLATDEKQLASHVIMKKLGYVDTDLTKKKMELDPTNSLNQQLPKGSTSEAETNRRAGKRNEQVARAQSQGTAPSGVGKEWNRDVELEYKQIQGSETMDVDFRMFIKLYGEDKMYSPGKPPRLFVRRSEDSTTIMYKSTDFSYRTKIKNSEINNILFLNLESNNIYRMN